MRNRGAHRVHRLGLTQADQVLMLRFLVVAYRGDLMRRSSRDYTAG